MLLASSAVSASYRFKSEQNKGRRAPAPALRGQARPGHDDGRGGQRRAAQRALFDAFRDLLPPRHGLKPTIGRCNQGARSCVRTRWRRLTPAERLPMFRRLRRWRWVPGPDTPSVNGDNPACLAGGRRALARPRVRYGRTGRAGGVLGATPRGGQRAGRGRRGQG